MKYPTKIFAIFAVMGLLLGILSACQADPEPEPQPELQPEPQKDVLYVNITWHQHQPLYYKDSQGNYTRPWVRVHATKDYLDMAEKTAEYEDVRVTFNLTPSLIRQLEDLTSGAKDIYWVLSEKPVTELTDADKRFILERFYDVNWDNIIARYPRYQELLDKRGGTDEASIQAALTSFDEQDFLDLQIWFNLAWFDPTYLAQEPLAGLVEKGEGFVEEDKIVLFDEVLEVLQAVIPYHKKLQIEGQIEVTTTPYAHPILPLIYDNQLALVGNPSAEMPDRSFSYPQDAEAHLALSVDMYEDIFDLEVRGLWPGEGAVAQEIVSMVADAGYDYMQTGEPVLAKSLGIESFTRNSQGFVQEPDLLYRPYYVSDDRGNQVGIFFRDWTLSDNIGFVYTDMSGEDAANDLVGHLETIHANFVENEVEGPHIISIILDGENAWEHYPNDGNDFLNALYRRLSESTVLQTVTPSVYLEMFPEQRPLEDLFPGAWFSPNYDTWIGETEEGIAWDYLSQVREDLTSFETGDSSASQDALEQAFDFMYLAEGSDWFWWYGDDQDSGQDSYFDEGFRALLAGVYESLDEDVPRFVQVPIIQASPVAATRPFSGISTPEMDGEDDPAWESAAYYEISGVPSVSGLYYTLDSSNIYIRLDTEESLTGATLGFYLTAPSADVGSSAFSRVSDELLGFNANKLVEWTGGVSMDVYDAAQEGWTLSESDVGQAMVGEGMIEYSLPLGLLGELTGGDALKLAVIIEDEGRTLPVDGPAQVIIPDLGEATVVLDVEDPEGDDYGPGTYTYPEDAVFEESVFDAKSFTVGYDSENLILTFSFVGPVNNPWGSPNGLSVQTMDVYIDVDPGEGTGARLLLPGRNAALEEGFGWEYAVWAEGWESRVVQVDPETLDPVNYSEASSAMRINVDPAKSEVIVRVPLSFLPEGNPMDWAYAAAVLGQEGYPSQGVWRVRNVEQTSAQYAFGGAPDDVNHTRIIDLILPEGGERDQAELLSDYPSSQESIDDLSPDDFAQIPMLQP